MSENDRGDESEIQAIEIEIDPLQLLIARVYGFARSIRGAEQENLPAGNIVFRDFNPPLRLNASDYWLRFGETFEVTGDGGQKYMVRVPLFAKVHSSFVGGFVDHIATLEEKNAGFFNRIAIDRSVTDSPGRWREILQRYHELKPAEQEEGIEFVRYDFARFMLVNSFGAACIETFSKLLQEKPSDAHARIWQQQISEAKRLRERFASDEETFNNLFNRYYWEDNALPGQEGPQVIRFLPRTPREKRGNEEDGPPPIDPPPVEIEEDDIKVVPKEKAGQRLAFYRTLGCRRVVRPKKVFGKEEHNYFGYMVSTRKGTWLIIVDCDAFGNAAYIFKVDPNDPFRWVIDVQKPRMELRHIEAQRHELQPAEDEAPTYVGREFHDETFEQRMKRRYEED